MLVDRERELDELNALLQTPAARLVGVSGRRRLGKTTLLIHWARTSQHPYLYWVASHFPSNVLLRQFSQQVRRHGNPDQRVPRTFSYEGWPEGWKSWLKCAKVSGATLSSWTSFPTRSTRNRTCPLLCRTLGTIISDSVTYASSSVGATRA